MIKNTENPQMLVYYLNKYRQEITKIANAEKGTYKLTDLYRVIRPAFEEAPSKPYTNDKINSFGKTVKNNRASAESQAKSLLYILERNETIMGYGGGTRKPLQPKVILTDEELDLIDTEKAGK